MNIKRKFLTSPFALPFAVAYKLARNNVVKRVSHEFRIRVLVSDGESTDDANVVVFDFLSKPTWTDPHTNCQRAAHMLTKITIIIYIQKYFKPYLRRLNQSTNIRIIKWYHRGVIDLLFQFQREFSTCYVCGSRKVCRVRSWFVKLLGYEIFEFRSTDDCVGPFETSDRLDFGTIFYELNLFCEILRTEEGF